MSWRDRLRPASFRGARFLIEDATGEFGRRLEVHEYPKRDIPFAEDMGRTARRFRLRGYAIGANYMAQRDALQRACEAEGPATLVHPYLGEQTVACEFLGVTERRDEGGYAVFDLEFVEAGAASAPTAIVATVAAVASAAAGLAASARTDLARHFGSA